VCEGEPQLPLLLTERGLHAEKKRERGFTFCVTSVKKFIHYFIIQVAVGF
jgi:hypothetical protein